jgi:hypothetical protein
MRSFAYVGLALALVPVPEGWRQESFEFPLQFAKTIPYEGAEHVRVTPQWTRFSAEDAFSYAFVWDVKARPVTADDLEDYLEAYFNGLMQNVGVARKLETDPVPAAVALHPMTGLAGWSQAHGAEIRTWNAFSRGERLLLRAEITRRDCAPDRMQIFFALSKAPRTHPTWNGLRALRDATTC